MNAIYKRRRDLLVEALRSIGVDCRPSPRPPSTCGSRSRRVHLGRLRRACARPGGVVITPGNGYGAAGEGFVRISLTAPDDRITEAVARIRRR